MLILFFCLAEILAIFFITRFLTNEIYFFLIRLTRNQHLSAVILTILYLPGTIVHEMSHYVVAVVLLLHVKEISLWPEINNNNIKLGSVRYIKSDVIRGFLVGIAPLVIGILLFYLIFHFHFFPLSNIWITIPFAYLLFIISINMFSSKQDMVDAIFLIPIVFIVGLVIYIFNINLSLLFSNSRINTIMLDFIKQLQIYMLFVLISCVLLLGGLKLINKLLKR